ncbi:hypothetical protein C0995_007383 [Termitomyces sp. Mi166|nr:hypothetical protein C0995_007383 [Termitomyces sp. Mi166\
MEATTEHIFVLHEFIDGEARNWFHHHVLHTNRDKQDWTFKEVLIGLYNCFVNAATMQEAREAFQTAVYDAQMGIQTFYEAVHTAAADSDAESNVEED